MICAPLLLVFIVWTILVAAHFKQWRSSKRIEWEYSVLQWISDQSYKLFSAHWDGGGLVRGPDYEDRTLELSRSMGLMGEGGDDIEELSAPLIERVIEEAFSSAAFETEEEEMVRENEKGKEKVREREKEKGKEKEKEKEKETGRGGKDRQVPGVGHAERREDDDDGELDVQKLLAAEMRDNI